MTALTSAGPFARPASLKTFQAARRVCVAASAAALGLYLASPFVTLWSIGSAIQTHDMTALGQAINWSELDASLTHQTPSGPHPERGGRAGAVRPGEPGLLAFRQRGGGLDEDGLPAVLLADLVEASHGVREPGSR